MVFSRIFHGLVTCAFLALLGAFSFGDTQLKIKPFDKSESEIKESHWVDSIFMSLDLDEKIGQLIMIRAHSDLGQEHIQSVLHQISRYHVGGLCFFQGTPSKQVKLTNQYQNLSKVPLMVAMDAEWGLGMRHKDDAMSFPKQMTLGAIADNELIYQMGSEIGRQLRRIGVHINFAPVVDINNNPLNPVINERSFGEDRKKVSVKSYMYMLGLQDKGVMACAKHFPGHGDTDMDSHKDLPSLAIGQQRLDSLELYPFKILAHHGLQSIMTAHLQIPAWDPDSITPVSLSSKAINQVLLAEMNFKGLIFTDGLEMKGVQKNFQLGDIEVQALKAGNDILLLPQDIEIAFRAIKDALKSGDLSTELVEYKVKKILAAKYKMRLFEPQVSQLDNLEEDLHTPRARGLRRKLYRRALTCLQASNEIPYLDVQNKTYASLAIGTKKRNNFQSMLDNYTKFKHYNGPIDISSHQSQALFSALKKYDRVVIGIHDMSRSPQKKFGINEELSKLIHDLDSITEVVVVLFGNPYALKYLGDNLTTLVAYEDNDVIRRESAQALFGSFPINGKLPVSVSQTLKMGAGADIGSLRRLGFAIPEMVYMDSDSLKRIDAIVKKLIKAGAAPGCQVLVVKNRSIIYQKSFGHFTYEHNNKVRNEHLYDIASITKTAAATLAIMKLVDDGLVSLSDPLSKYIPKINTTNKANMTLYDIMSHHAGLIPFINFYTPTLSDDPKYPKPLDLIYHDCTNEEYCIPVAKDLFLRKDYVDTIWHKIYGSNVRSSTNYRYSDLGFYMIADLVKNVTGQSLDRYVKTHFYDPLGLRTITYTPLKTRSSTQIVPSENDDYFRYQKLKGHVHDMGAAMLGGVSGHAGLFSNAYDLAVIYQMLLNKGYYGGMQYFSPSTVEIFTTRHNRSLRRGIGFDMKQLDTTLTLNMSEWASDETFGHLGFTGTAVWTDPKEDLIFVFLSNRTFPTMKNNKLGHENYRPLIQSAVYRSNKNLHGSEPQ